MKQGIVIGSTKSRKETWLKDLLASLIGCKYPIKVNFTDNFELTTIKWALTNTDFEEFLFLPDSTIIKDLSLFDIVFDTYKGKSVSLFNFPAVGGMYMMKYRRDILKTMPIPEVKSKLMAVFWEGVFNVYYSGLDGNVIILFPGQVHTNIFVKKYGRENMVVGNKYITRFKGDWGQRPLN